MSKRAAFRGQPLLLLGGLLATWVGVRATTWQAPFDLPVPPAMARALLPAHPAAELSPSASAESSAFAPAPRDHGAASSIMPRLRGGPTKPLATSISRPEVQPGASVPSGAVIAHDLKRLSVDAPTEIPPALSTQLDGPSPIPPSGPLAAPISFQLQPTTGSGTRWSADGWLLWRADSAAPLSISRPSYGRSQVGAVVRYRLADGATLPQAYARVSSALSGAREREVALGLSARPLASVPVRLAAEARVSETTRGTEVRPGLYAVTELLPVPLPRGFRGEGYAQVGYVGGTFATAFVDGQARVDRQLLGAGDAELRAGAGIWGGAQKDASRLDVGPTAAVDVRLGATRARVAADYRFRIAGDAAPANGPALTLSAGF